MTTISVTFVICLSENFHMKNSTGKRRSINRANKVEEEEIEESFDLKTVEEIGFESTLQCVVYIDKPIKSLQLDYEIIPKLIYTVEVLFWGAIAKIITKDGIKYVSTITKLKNRWITFTVEHKIMLDINELMLYKSHSICVNMHLDKNVTASSPQDTSSLFFENEDVEHNCIFAEAFEYIPCNDFEDTTIAIENVKLILREILHFSFRGEILSRVKLPSINCRKKILKMINAFTANVEYVCFNTFAGEEAVNVTDILNAKPPTPAVSKKGEKKKTPKEKKVTRRRSIEQETNTFQISIPGQALFTDPNLTVFNFPKRTKDMKCCFVIVNVEHLISSFQKSILNPVVVRLNKLINVPVEILNKERFEYLYLTYNLCGIDCMTRAKPIEKTIYFKNHKIHFLEKKIKLFAQQVQKDYLIVQVHGLRKRLVKNVPELFGTNPKDAFFSEPMKNKKDIAKYTKDIKDGYNETIFIAVACFKLNSLLSIFRSFSQTEFCLHPIRCPMQLTKNIEQHANTFNTNFISIDNASTTTSTGPDEPIVYPLSEDMLLDSELCLKVQMELQKPINKLLDSVIEKESFFNRIILITGHGELAKYILSNVLTHNSCWIYKDDIVPPNYLPNSESTTDINNANIISGFSIDNGDIYIMYLEGNTKWIKHILWQHICNEFLTCAKILYNSDHFYKDRVYANLIPYGGVYNITLHSSLKSILECSKIFSKGYLPEPCRRAFKKIDMILKSKSTNEITIHMLPTKKELLSLDIEWGVPIHWPLT